MSTLRGPNPLGAYLILPLITLFGMTVHFLRQYHRSSNRQSLVLLIGSGLGFVLSLVVLYGSQSRSAWLGFVVALGLFVLLLAPLKIQKILIALGVAGVIVASFGVYQLRDTSFVQNVILHDNPNIGPKETSNSGHSEALRQALGDIKDRPILGCGPGCAGPASFYDPDGARLAENNFLQIAQETGVIGLALFIVTTILIGVELLRRRDDAVALMFFASLVGLSVANLLLHVWSDDTLAYVWWGALGYVLATRLPAGAVLKSKQ